MPSQPKLLPSGAYRCQVSTGVKNDKGRYIYDSVTAETDKKAYKLALILEEEYKEKRRDPTSMTLDAAIQKYENDKSNILSPSTIRGYEIIRKNRFKEIMGMRISKITKQVLQDAVNREILLCSAKTISNAYGLVSSVISEYAGVRFSNIRLPMVIEEEKECLDTAQLMKFIAFCIGDTCEVPMLIAVWLGLRRSEILGLKWKAIDFEKNKLSVENAVVPDKDNKLVSTNRTKTKKSHRNITCPSFILNKLLKMQKQQMEASGTDNADDIQNQLIFKIHPDTLRKHVKAICRKAGITEIGVHGLRHTNASVMLTLGFMDKIAMSRGGWSFEKIMKDRYQHAFKADMDSADKSIDDYFNALLEGTIEGSSQELSHDLSHENPEPK